MNILLISYRLYEYDGRLRELINISKTLGSTTYITRSNGNVLDKEKSHILISTKDGFWGYLKFIFKSVNIALQNKEMNVLFIDDRRAVLPALIIKLFRNSLTVIQDVRELWIAEEVKHLRGKIGCFFEKKLIKQADLLICANSYRAKIMKKYYSLPEEPLVYENIRILSFSKDYSELETHNKLSKYIEREAFKIIVTSGCDISRTTDKLVLAMKDLGDEFELLIVGGGSKEDEKIITELIEKNAINNIKLIGRLGENELKFLIQKCDVGIVNYNKIDTNNKYCASGKIYEFTNEGLPVVTTENIPLIEMVNQHSIGVADDNYANGILTIKEHYDEYKKNVCLFSQKIDVKNNNLKLVSKIKELLNL